MAALDRLSSLGYARPLAVEALRQASRGRAFPVIVMPAPSARGHSVWLLQRGPGARDSAQIPLGMKGNYVQLCDNSAGAFLLLHCIRPWAQA
jgi:hypothetical protein